jgi:hypothetical protein
MTEQEFDRRAELLRSRVDEAHMAWLRAPSNAARLSRFERALLDYQAGRQDLTNRYFMVASTLRPVPSEQSPN